MLALQRSDAWLDLDLTLPQLRVLFAVRRRTGCTVSELAQTLGRRLAATSALANRLVRAGLLRRVSDQDDRRRIRLELSDKAEQMLTMVDQRSADRFAAILGRMSTQGRAALADALSELIELVSSDLLEDLAPGADPNRTEKGFP
ncbi:DNA-binding transcriptional regulator, MarR family [Nonomuraea solani]|uniref:DNA-binding transcriptional regulator, MarR family n=1 Tax=Nonomuraea solani TaxID=1144553 RepID=A0A1H6F426_9ACTN|nr:MarR family transcriptional regulator [Nonomuraea solani]SEH04009.1 DNA-binding transcriptional regulator, MarR family [Nonomuraea solani]